MTPSSQNDHTRSEEEALGRQKLESLGKMANGIAHDFNNLLAGILASVDIMLADGELGGPSEELQRIKTTAVRGSEIVRELMRYSRTESPEFQLVDVASLVGEMAHVLRILISKQVILNVSCDTDLPAVYANPAQIRQVVMNLVTNASEAIGARHGVIQVGVERTSAEADTNDPEQSAGEDHLRLTVSDSGSGMTPEVQARIFDPYYTTKFTGHGLGLATVQGIVRGHEGEIRVVSSIGQGTTFEVLLPCTNLPAKAVPDIPALVDEGGPTGTVLVVEDEETLRFAVSKMLRFKGFPVLEAGDGATALELFRVNQEQIAVVLLDMTLPVMDGPELFVELQRARPDVKVILTTAYSQEAGWSLFIEKQPWGFIRKPYRLHDLLTLIRKACSADSQLSNSVGR